MYLCFCIFFNNRLPGERGEYRIPAEKTDLAQNEERFLGTAARDKDDEFRAKNSRDPDEAGQLKNSRTHVTHFSLNVGDEASKFIDENHNGPKLGFRTAGSIGNHSYVPRGSVPEARYSHEDIQESVDSSKGITGGNNVAMEMHGSESLSPPGSYHDRLENLEAVLGRERYERLVRNLDEVEENGQGAHDEIDTERTADKTITKYSINDENDLGLTTHRLPSESYGGGPLVHPQSKSSSFPGIEVLPSGNVLKNYVELPGGIAPRCAFQADEIYTQAKLLNSNCSLQYDVFSGKSEASCHSGSSSLYNTNWDPIGSTETGKFEFSKNASQPMGREYNFSNSDATNTGNYEDILKGFDHQYSLQPRTSTGTVLSKQLEEKLTLKGSSDARSNVTSSTGVNTCSDVGKQRKEKKKSGRKTPTKSARTTQEMNKKKTPR